MERTAFTLPRKKLNIRNALSTALSRTAMAVIVSLVVVSCAKDEDLAEVITDLNLTDRARASFEGKRGANTADTSGFAHLQKSGTLFWENSVTLETEKATYVFVPLKSVEALYSGESGGQRHPISSQLRASTADGKAWVFDLVTYVPEGNGWEASGGFTGTAVAHGWFGGGTQMAHFHGGELLKNGRGPDGRITKLMGTTCYTTTVYGYVNGMLNTTYTSTTCISSSGGSGSGGQWGPLPEPDPRIDDGNGVGGAENNYSRDITNQIDDPCLKQTITKALTYSELAADVISDIIQELSGNAGLRTLDITVKDGVTRLGYPGEAIDMSLQKENGVPILFRATIVLDEAYMPDVSQEGAVAIFIHEVIHAYLAKADLSNNTKFNNHQTMAIEYVDPMASYLRELFDISEFDAFSLAWSGLTDAGAYINVSSFEIGGTTYSKNDVAYAAAKYKGRGADGNLLDGRELCDD